MSEPTAPWLPTTYEREAYGRASVRIAAGDRIGVRLLCPRGHRLTDVGIIAIGGDPKNLFPQSSGPNNQNGYFADTTHAGAPKVKLVCQNKRCNYQGTYLIYRLLALVLETAEAGQARLAVQS